MYFFLLGLLEFPSFIFYIKVCLIDFQGRKWHMKEQRKIGSKGNIMAYDCKDYYGLQIKEFKYLFLDTEFMTNPRYSEQF